MKAQRTTFVCGNLKLNLYRSDVERLVEQLVSGLRGGSSVEVAIAPVVTTLSAACDRATGTPLKVAAQNVFYEDKGAFTGEWSARHVRELGCAYAIVGHSERRQYFFETDKVVAAKVKACIGGDLSPIACVGETLAERNAEQVKQILERQLIAIMSSVSSDAAAKLVIAYEPIWAIGTGVNATPAQVQEAHAFIRSVLAEQFGDVSSRIRILYGGSVKPDNTFALLSLPDVDGALVGGASLQADSFLAIVNEAKRAKSAIE